MTQEQPGAAARSPTLYYVGPFFAFLAVLALSRKLSLPAVAVQAGFVALMLGVLAALVPSAAPKKDWRVHNWIGSLLLGVAVFIVWIGPDLLFPNYRHHWVFENSLTGTLKTSVSSEGLSQPVVLWLRSFRAAAIVPVVEELFWRAWLMRWIISPQFETVPLGTWSAQSFWITAALFASEHGPYWDVGLAAGVIYNWWMLRTRSIGDLVIAHAVTNACLSAYVIWAGKWEYWL